jgi:hypothetical protein
MTLTAGFSVEEIRDIVESVDGGRLPEEEGQRRLRRIQKAKRLERALQAADSPNPGLRRSGAEELHRLRTGRWEDCSAPRRPILYHKGKVRSDGSEIKPHVLVITTPCQRWKCDGCRPRLVARWREHFRDLLAKRPDPDAPVYVARVDRGKSWNAACQRIRRAGGPREFVAVNAGDGQPLLVFSESPNLDGGRGETAVRAKELSPADAVAKLGAALHNYRGDLSPISTSRRWAIVRYLDADQQRIRQLRRALGLIVKGAAAARIAKLQALSTTRRLTAEESAELSLLRMSADDLRAMIDLAKGYTRPGMCHDQIGADDIKAAARKHGMAANWKAPPERYRDEWLDSIEVTGVADRDRRERLIDDLQHGTVYDHPPPKNHTRHEFTDV